ncbi:MAG: hypothetical protein ACYDB9_02725 [Gammaproteobacteria bacterium]
MKPEVFRLAITAMMTGLLFVPWVLDRLTVRGLMGTLANPNAADKPQHEWAQRG